MTASQVSLGSAVFAAMPVCLPLSLVNPSFVLVSTPLFSYYQDPLVFILKKFSVLYQQAGKEYIPSYVRNGSRTKQRLSSPVWSLVRFWLVFIFLS